MMADSNQKISKRFNIKSKIYGDFEDYVRKVEGSSSRKLSKHAEKALQEYVKNHKDE